MAPRREPFETKDGRNYTLWADIDDTMSAVIPAYYSDSRERRRERGWMFRGQTTSEWDLIPSLYRPPVNDGIVKSREDYTEAFIEALESKCTHFGLSGLSRLEYLAIAQHYGLYTSLLDFTWNAEVAAYFATFGSQQGQVGVIFAFNFSEYQGMRNPFAALGSTTEESDNVLKQAGLEPLPDLKLVQLHNISRIYEQEGLFIHVPPEKIGTLMHECIDRFYFRQRNNKVYAGNFPHKAHALPHRRLFDTDATYEAFLDMLRKEQPHVFDLTGDFGTTTLFPPADPLSKFAESWKREHADPTKSDQTALYKKPVYAIPITKGGAPMMPFSEQVENYYSGDYSRSPYQSQYLSQGRNLVEFLCDNHELDDPGVQRWLLWELLKRNMPGGLKCTLKLGNAKSWGSGQEGFQFTVVDRWLADSFQHSLPRETLENGYSQISFGALSTRGRPEIDVCKVDPFTPPLTMGKALPSNPHKGSHARSILDAVESRLMKVEDGVVGSFLYDLHHIVMISMGRDLHLTAAIVESAPCFQRSPLVQSEHVDGPALLVRLTDRFTGGVTHTAVCSRHWNHMSEGDVDVMNSEPWILLGLA